MKILVFGSLNIDKTYRLASLVKPGQTIAAKSLELYCGGKGFNQAVAFSRAGSDIYFAGAVGSDGEMLTQALEKEHIRLDYLLRMPGESGHAVIQVDDAGRNSIIILAGANGEITKAHIDETLAHFTAGDFILLQNEISHGAYLLKSAKERGMIVALNPSPIDKEILQWDLSLVDYLVINEVEGAALADTQDEKAVLERLHQRFPSTNILLTLGKSGAVYLSSDGQQTRGAAYPVKAVDTTGAGDTFAGFFFSELLRGSSPAYALRVAAVASGIAVSRKGAAASIPTRAEVDPVCRQAEESWARVEGE